MLFLVLVGKGEGTRQTVLEQAFRRATRLGLEGVTIGGLAEDLGMSKSGLFAHFQSKEALQLATIEFAAARFVDAVVNPTLKAPRGEPRLRALLESWIAWETDRDGGCFFAAAAFELDDRPGPVRELLVKMQRDLLEFVANIARTGVAEGHFRADLDPEQMAFDLYGITLVMQHHARLLGDAKAHQRARAALDALLAAARPVSPPRASRRT